MKKRIFAVLLALALVVTVGALAVSAKPTTKSLNVEETIASAYVCPCHGTPIGAIGEWTDLTAEITELVEGTHYRVPENYTHSEDSVVSTTTVMNVTGNVLINLNGNDLPQCGTRRYFAVSAGKTLTIVGEGTVTGAAAGGSGVFSVGAGGTVNLFDATLEYVNTSATATGGVVSLTNGSSDEARTVFNMYSGVLKGAETFAQSGGVVAINKYGTFNMYSGTVYGSKLAAGKYGGAIYTGQGTAAINIYGGTVYGGRADQGCAIRIGAAPLYIGGNAVIDGGNSFGGAVYCGGNGTYIIEGNAKIINGSVLANTDLTVAGTPTIESVALPAGEKILIGESGLQPGASIGVSAASGATVISEGVTDALADCFYSTNESELSVTDGALVASRLLCPCGCNKYVDEIEWTSWDGKTNITTIGHYRLSATASTSSQKKIYAKGIVVIDMNGCNASNSNSHYSITQDTPIVHVINSGGIGGVLRGCRPSSPGGVMRVDCGEFHIYGGVALEPYTDTTTASNATNGSGRIVGVQGTGKFFMHGGCLNGAGYTTNKGEGIALYVTGETASAEILDGTVNGGKADNGAAIAVQSSGSLTIKGGTINGGSATYGGAIYLASSSSLTMTKGTITGGVADRGGNIYITSSTAEISGGIVENGTTNKKQIANVTENTTYGGGNILIIDGTSELTISGNASIQGGRANAASSDNHRGGGNICIVGGTVNVNGGTIKDGTTNASGGNIMTRGGTLNISAGTISGGTAGSGAGYGGDSIALRDNTTVITGGTINSITPVRDGYTSLTISGAPTIASLDLVGHVNDGKTPVVTLGEGGVTGGSITVNASENTPFSAADATLAESSKVYFHSAVEGLSVGVVDNCLVLMEVQLPCPHCGEIVEWVEWNGNKDVFKVAIDPNTHYVLTQNKNTGGQIAVGANATGSASKITNTIIIDLNGYDLTNTGRVFAVYAGSTLNLVNTSETESVLSGAYASSDNGGVINVTGGANLNLYENITVEMTNENYADDGGVVSIAGGGVFNLKGATLTGTTARYGGAVFVEDSTFNFEEGIINGGHIVSGTYTARGGAVYLDNSNFSMTGGTITGGTVESAEGGSTTQGGNLYISNTGDQTVTISGGIIENGTAINGNGGNILVNNGSITISGAAQITGGDAQRGIALNNGGGNIYGMPSTNIAINGGSISGGKTNSIGANVFARGALEIADRDIISGGSSAVAYAGEVAVVGASGVLTVGDLGADWSGDICLVNGATLTGDEVGAHLAYFDQRDFEIWYATLDEVKAADTEDTAESVTYIKLTADGTYDLDGHVVNVNGVTATINGAVTGFDTTNDDYEGYGVVTLGTAPTTNYIAPNGYLYIAVKEAEGQYSFHRLNMEFERLSIRPRNAGVYYSSRWKADNALVGNWTGDEYEAIPLITGYGMALKKTSPATGDSFTNGDKFAYTYFDNDEGETTDFLCKNNDTEINSCLLSNIINETNGAVVNQVNAEVMIYATPYVEIINSNGDTEYVMGPTYGDTLKGIVEWVVSEIDAMEETDRTKNIGFITPLDEFARDCGLDDYFTGLADLING